jgi:hypothetical protein
MSRSFYESRREVWPGLGSNSNSIAVIATEAQLLVSCMLAPSPVNNMHRYFVFANVLFTKKGEPLIDVVVNTQDTIFCEFSVNCEHA